MESGAEHSEKQTPVVTTRVRLVFVAAVALFAAQSHFIHRFGEPYPAIVMPGFAGSGGYRDGVVEIDRFEAVFVAEGEEYSFPPKVLLEEFPVSHHGAIASTSLTPRNDLPQPVPRASRSARLRDAIFPGYAARAASRNSPDSLASLQEWLSGRARVLVPGRQVARVEIRWFKETIGLDNGKQTTQRDPSGTLIVELDGERK